MYWYKMHLLVPIVAACVWGTRAQVLFRGECPSVTVQSDFNLTRVCFLIVYTNFLILVILYDSNLVVPKPLLNFKAPITSAADDTFKYLIFLIISIESRS